MTKSYAEEIPKQKWEKRSILAEGIEVPIKAAKSIELPYVWFERKGLSALHDPVIKAGRDAEVMKTQFTQRFKDVGLFKEGGWFTADRFNLSKSESFLSVLMTPWAICSSFLLVLLITPYPVVAVPGSIPKIIIISN